MSPRRRRSPSTFQAVARRARALCALAAALAAPAGAQSRDTATGEAAPLRYAATVWNTEHGLPSSIVNGVAQTADGYLWAATYEGLVRFDGTTFRTFSDGDIPGLERGSFVVLLVQPAADGDPSGGTLWAASESGELVRWRGGRWRVFGTRDGLPGVGINSLALDADGTLLLGSRLGVWRLRGERAAPLAWPAGQAASPAVAALAADGRGTIWVGTVADGLLRLRDGRVTRLTTRDGLASDRVDALLADPDGTLWVGAYGALGVARVRGDRIEHFGTRVAGPGGADSTRAPRRVRALLRDRAGTLWLGAENGVFALRGAEPRVAELVPLADPGAIAMGLDDAGGVKADALREDAEGNLWVGTRQTGLFRLRAASFATLGPADGLPAPFAFAVDGDGAGGAWVATREGVAHLPARGAPADVPALRGQPVRDLLRAPDGDVWIGTTVGLVRLAGGRPDRAATYTRRDGLTDDRVRALAAGRGGVVWAATFDGVTEWRDGRFHRYGRAEGLADGYVLAVLEDAVGTLWVGTQTAGLFRCPAPRFDAPAERRRCEPGPAALARQPVFRLTEDADGTLWAGTARGLARLRRSVPHGPVTSVALLTPRHGLPGRTIFQALDDGRGALWLTGPWGIGRVSRDALHAVADGRAPSLEVTPFGRGDGMAAREASSIGRAWRAPDGTLWFPTPLGVSVVDPARLPPRAVAPRAHVEQALADGVTLDLQAAGADGAIALRPGTRALEFRVAVPSLTAPERVRLRWRLEPFDGAWVDGGTRRVAEYTHLPPDRYRFVVQARVGDGPWGDAAGATLRLAPRLWQRPGVVGVVAVALLALVAVAYRRHTRVLLRRATERAAQAAREEALRAVSLRDELTGLYNRRGLLALAEQELRAAMREDRGFTLLFADLDGLKRINDTLGHAVGDLALQEAAAVLRASFRDADVVARLGGDEFVVLLRDPPAGAGGDGDDAAVPAGVLAAAQERLAEALGRHNAVAGRTFALTMSMGTSRFDPLSPRTVEALLEDADRRMYGIKRARRATRELAAIGDGAAG